MFRTCPGQAAPTPVSLRRTASQYDHRTTTILLDNCPRYLSLLTSLLPFNIFVSSGLAIIFVEGARQLGPQPPGAHRDIRQFLYNQLKVSFCNYRAKQGPCRTPCTWAQGLWKASCATVCGFRFFPGVILYLGYRLIFSLISFCFPPQMWIS